MRLTQQQGSVASNAYSLVDLARRTTRNYAHPTGAEVADTFFGTSTVTVPFGSPLADSTAKVTFDPRNPIRTSYDKSSMENGYDPKNTGSATTRLDINNTNSFASLLTPHTHVTYKVTPRGETMTAWTGLHEIKVDIHDGTWTLEPGLEGRLVLPGFDDRSQRFDMYMGTSMTPPGPMIGEG